MFLKTKSIDGVKFLISVNSISFIKDEEDGVVIGFDGEYIKTDISFYDFVSDLENFSNMIRS